jgi:lambda family phage portal protein
MFGYDAVKTTRRRKAPTSTTKDEDSQLSKAQRRALIGTTRDQRRNMALLAYMVRKHIDNVASVKFKATTGNKQVDDQLESLVAWWSRRDRCDVAGRHSFQELTRLWESHRALDGDVGVVLLRSGQLQTIEGDRIAKPSSFGDAPKPVQETDWVHGVDVNDANRARRYCIVDRNGTTLNFNRTIRAQNLKLIGYFDRIDQVRGISPLSAAVDVLQDIHEANTYQLLKAKFAAMFGVAIKRDIVSSDTDGFTYTDAADGSAADSSTAEYEFELKPGLKMELNPGDSIDVIESKTPSKEYAEYINMMIQIAMLALDLPITFFDSRKSSYSSARQDLLQYNESAKHKRASLTSVLDEIIAWRISKFIADGNIILPRGMSMRDMSWQWIPNAVPWIDPLKEVNADVQAIASGLKSRTMVCAERGHDWEDVLNQLEQEEQALIARSVTVQIGQPGAITTRDEEVEDAAGASSDNEDTEDE